MDFLQATRDGYDATATQYVTHFHDYLQGKPVELAMLSAFAGLVRASGRTSVTDVGCGTGATTAILHDLGMAVSGIDLSPKMLDEARRLNPHLAFTVGSMTDLDLPDEAVGGLCAWYSVIHVPDAVLPQVLSEFHGVLAPGGVLLLAFQVGDQPRRLTEAFGVAVTLEFHRRAPAVVASALRAAGFTVYLQTVREADDNGLESTPQAFLIARKPA